MKKILALAVLAVLAAAARADDLTFKVGETSFTRPAKWEVVPVTSSMRKAQLKVAGENAKTNAEVAFFQFGAGPMGGVKANVDRWLGQFVEPRDKTNTKTAEVTVGKTKVTYVQAEGTYKSGMPGQALTPMPDYALAGAIIEASDGNIFVKMTGPKALVRASARDFKTMVESGLK